jgi:hypothetical protein
MSRLDKIAKYQLTDGQEILGSTFLTEDEYKAAVAEAEAMTGGNIWYEKVCDWDNSEVYESLAREQIYTPERVNRFLADLGQKLGVQVENFADYHDGFSFTVPTELAAYKAAYLYQGSRVVVKYAPNIEAWSVAIYNK